MKITLVPIGNSRGVRLPKAVLEQVGLTDEAELSIEDGRIVLAPLTPPRIGWAQAFADDPSPAADEDHDWLEAPLGDDAE